MDLSSQILLLKEENRKLLEENQAKSDFLSMMIHQLRTPLSATKWIFKMILDGDLGTVSPPQKNIILRGFESNEQMIHMLSEISQANHMNEWSMHFVIKPIDIASCINDTLIMFTGEAHSKNITIAFHEPKHLPLVMADKEKLSIVIQNLIENGLKYNKKNGSLLIKAEVFKNNLVISFTDTGIGIPLENQSTIFKKFYRAPNAQQVDKGTGLGLFVGKEIIEGHHGSLWFESTEGVGTTFFFSLPLPAPINN